MVYSALFLLLSLFVFLMAAGASTETTMRPRLDLSGHHNLPGTILAQVIQSSCTQNEEDDGVEIDISNSALKDQDFDDILQALYESRHKYKQIYLVARMNQLRFSNSASFFQKLLLLNSKNETSTTAEESERPTIESMDLSWNPIQNKEFANVMERLVAHPCCPSVLRLEGCGIGPSTCRAIAKGLMQRRDSSRPLSLHLAGNPNIGDAGVAALAAAIRTIGAKKKRRVLATLDLSACGVGNVGAEALALALEGTHERGCSIGELDLSNNRVSDLGTAAIARTLFANSADTETLSRLNLSYNKDIGDRGATELAAAWGARLPHLELRSCNVYAEGATAFGAACRNLIKEDNQNVYLDLSGNPLGVLRGKSKSDGGKYSASKLKSKASATATSYMNSGLGFLKKSLKEVGVTSVLGSDISESDDDEDKASENFVGDSNEFKAPCGAKAMANAFIKVGSDMPPILNDKHGKIKVSLGLRHCFFDHGAADALAAMLVASKRSEIEISIDASLNHILEESMIAALHSSAQDNSLLNEMADRHMDVLDAIKEARERAAEAATSIRARSATLHSDAFDNDWGDLPDAAMTDDEAWDSNAGKA
jgi:hypothetical protein